MGDIILWFPKGKRDTLIVSKNSGLVHTKYNISFIIIFYFFINIDKFESNHSGECINKLKTYQCLDQAPKGLEATIEGGGEHKHDF